MSKSRPFSIYLLKPHYNAANSLIEDHHLGEVPAGSIPAGSSMFILDGEPSDPWWKPYFGIQIPLKQITKSALLFLPVDDKCFALSFGHAHHKLKDESFEYDFGLRVTLNCVDPNELKSTDTLDPGAALRRRTQLPVGSDLTYFDFDRNSAILKSLTGKVLPEYRELFGNVTGSSSLSVRSSVGSGELVAFCRQLLALYHSQGYRTTFPDIENIVPVKDPLVIERLRDRLVEALRAKSESIYLTIPDIIDYRNHGYKASFSGLGSSLSHEDVFINKYYEYVETHGRVMEDLDYGQLCGHGLALSDEEGTGKENYSLTNCLIFDTALDNNAQTYHLTDGKWYRIQNSYIERLTAALDPLWVEIHLPHFAHDNEGHYNETIAAEDASFVCLDMSNIGPEGQTAIEPCDLYSVDGDIGVFHHIKRSTVSAQLSHLFNQGNNAIELIKLEEICLNNLRDLITARVSADSCASFLAPLAGKKYRVVFGIVTHKEGTRKSENLPLFSRVSLMRIARSLRLKDTDCQFGFIPDLSEKKAGVTKKRKLKAVRADEAQAAV